MTRTRVLMSALLVLAACVVSLSGGIAAQVQRQVRNIGLGDRTFRPVTDAMLEKPDPGDWINWRRTYDGTGYSPLTQINKQNVGQLALAWSWGMPAGQHQPTPLVHDGVMFLPTPGGGAQAVDATNGEFLWEYRPPQPREGNGNVRNTPTRNIAIYGDRIYVTTGDARLIALSARTGEVVWDTQVADPKLGYTYTAGALAVRGVIISSLTGCQMFKNDVCYIMGHDAQTGKELWRTSTVARPGEPGGDTWENLPLMFRAGGDAWMTGSFDPATNLVYWGTAQAKPWAQFQRGTVGDALYTNSTLALDPKTGKMAWYFQHLPGETHDMDEVFERVLVDVNGRQSIFSMGKLAVLWQIDRKTGAFIAARDPGYQTLIDIDPEERSRLVSPEHDSKRGRRVPLLPEHGGLQEPAVDGLSPGDARLLHSAESDVRGRDVRAGEARRRRRRIGTRETHQPHASGKPGRPRGAAGDGREREDSLAAPHAHASQYRRADHGRWPRARRTLGSLFPDIRCGDGHDSLHQPTHADARAGLPDYLRGQRQAVRGGSGRDRRRVLVEQHRHRYHPRSAHSTGHQLHLRVCLA